MLGNVFFDVSGYGICPLCGEAPVGRSDQKMKEEDVEWVEFFMAKRSEKEADRKDGDA